MYGMVKCDLWFQTGPRKYKRRRKLKTEQSPPSARDWAQSPTPPPATRTPSPAYESDAPVSPASPASPPSPPRRRRRRASPPPPPRPRMIHTSAERPRAERARAKRTERPRTRRRPPRHPADDLRAIRPHAEPEPGTEPEGPFKCEMCSLEFPRRDALLLHVPVHIWRAPRSGRR